jgi:hypothetical protein
MSRALALSRSLALVPAALLAASCALHHGSDAGCCASGAAASNAKGGDAACCCSADGAKGDAKAATATNGGAASAASDAAEKLADLGHQVDLAKRKADRARMDLEQQQRDGETALQRARAELELARQELATFQDVERPLKVGEAQINLKAAADALTDQQDEMKQLELMYEKDDLGDKTKEIVLQRSKRAVEQVKARLELAHRRYEQLESTQLAQQQTRLELALKGKEADVQRAEFAARTGMLDKETAVISANLELDKLVREQAKAKQSAEKVSLSAADGERLEIVGGDVLSKK